MASDREPRKLFEAPEAPPEVTFRMIKMFFSTQADPELRFRGGHGERGARAYNGGLGAEPQQGPWAEPLVRGQGDEAPPPEAESVLTLGRPTDTANLHPWPVAVFSV